MAGEVCRLIVLGSTGSIGTQTLDVVEHLNSRRAPGSGMPRYEVVGVAARTLSSTLCRAISRAGNPRVAIRHHEPGGSSGFECYHGPESAARLVEEVECDLVVSAISGAAGLPATLRAVELGRDVALAN